MKNGRSIWSNNYVALVVVSLAAFAAAFTMLPRCGKWASLPICLACAVVAGLTGLKWLYSCGIFAVMTYLLTSFSVADFEYSVISAVFAAATALIGCAVVALAKKRRASHAAVAFVLCAAACLGHFALFGYPIKAFGAADMLEQYTLEAYDESVTVGEIRYDREKSMFFAEVYGSNAVSEVKTVYCNGEAVFDNYRAFAELSVMKEARQTLQNALRDAFPNGSFSVVPVSTGGYPDGKISVSSQLTEISRMSFDINVTTALSTEKFTELAVDYIHALALRGISPASVRVRGGDVGEYFLTVTTLPVGFPTVVKVTYEPDDPLACYGIIKFSQRLEAPLCQ